MSSLIVRFWPKRCPSTLKKTGPSLGWMRSAMERRTSPGRSPIAGRRSGNRDRSGGQRRLEGAAAARWAEGTSREGRENRWKQATARSGRLCPPQILRSSWRSCGPSLHSDKEPAPETARRQQAAPSPAPHAGPCTHARSRSDWTGRLPRKSALLGARELILFTHHNPLQQD